MDIILIITLIAGVVIKSKAKKTNDKGKEQMGNILAGISALILIVLYVGDCMRAMP